ncbi:MAG: hypothetical protein JF606_05735 [Burkholderiales bacterium]|jgi:hypothetical protein|nr:hypothetical protein [Burkholderiales bacterium]
MSHQYTQVVPQAQSNKPVVPAAPSLPVPLDPSLLSQVSGGAGSSSSPHPTW